MALEISINYLLYASVFINPSLVNFENGELCHLLERKDLMN